MRVRVGDEFRDNRYLCWRLAITYSVCVRSKEQKSKGEQIRAFQI